MEKTFHQQSAELLLKWATLEKENSFRKGYAQASINNALQFKSHKSIRRQIGYTIATVETSAILMLKESINRIKK